MTERWASVVAVLCTTLAAACGPSAHEVRLRSTAHELHAELREQRQYNRDLKLRLDLAEARTKVLIDLVQGLTADAAQRDASNTLEAADASLVALDADLRALVAGVRHSQADIAAMSAQRAALEAELSRARGVLAAATAEELKDRERQAAYRALRDQLAPLIASHDVEVRVVEQRMVLSLPDVLLFARDEARLLPSATSRLEQLARVLAAVPERQFQVAAHVDARPMRKKRFADKWRLSAERALSVTLFLVEHGVAKERLAATAYADTRPLPDVTSEVDQYRNSRIEIVVLPNPDELPDLSRLREPPP
jgi:flagellar motor protein MotB